MDDSYSHLHSPWAMADKHITHNTYLPYFLFDRSDTHGYTTRQSFLHFASIPLKTRYRVGRRREVSDNKMYANFQNQRTSARCTVWAALSACYTSSASRGGSQRWLDRRMKRWQFAFWDAKLWQRRTRRSRSGEVAKARAMLEECW